MSVAYCFASKENNSLRACVDYRKVNTATIPDGYSKPQADKCIDSLCFVKVFPAFDINSSYGQIELSQSDVGKTTFVTLNGLHR